jgi:hypothetical protein
METKSLSTIFDYSPTLKYPADESISYSVKDDGIYRIAELLDQYRETMNITISTLIIPKEIFIEAFNTYIKND